MKKSAILFVSLGIIAACLTGCGTDDSSVCKSVNTGEACQNNTYYLCAGGREVTSVACPNGCEGTQCKLSSCVNGTMKCENGGMVQCVGGSWQKGSPCPGGCDALGVSCMTTCTNGQTKCTDNKEFHCVSGVWDAGTPCSGGCEGAVCKAASACSFVEPYCDASGNAVACVGGNTVQSSCACGCTAGICNADCSGAVCTYSGTRCLAEKSALFKCENGEETFVQTCSNGCDSSLTGCAAGVEEPDKKACTDIDGETVANGKKGCVSEYEVAECKDGKWGKVTKTCAEDEVCWEGACEVFDFEADCFETGMFCNEAGDSVMQCDDAGYRETVEKCIMGCTDGVCDRVSCDELKRPECADERTLLKCSGDVVVKEACPSDELCVSGECVAEHGSGGCAYEKECSADLTAIKTCKDGNVTQEACPKATACDEDKLTCESTVISGYCMDNFIPYCENDSVVVVCDENTSEIYETRCNGGEKCVNGRCGKVTNKKVGDDCTKENFPETCIGNVAVECNNKKKVAVKKTCESGEICGVVIDGGVASSGCYEPCTEKGSMRNTCTVGGGYTYESVMECISVDAGISDGRLGLEMVPGTWNKCDIGCKEGRCYDYTTGIEGVGEACDPAKVKSYCADDGRAVNCEHVDESDILTVEKCFFNEVCSVIGDEALCVETCKKGDPVKYICDDSSWLISSQKYECQEIDGQYVYVSTDIDVCATAKGCAADGRCNQ